MAKKRIEETVWDLVLPIVEECKYELVDVEYKKEGQNWYLRIYIDKEGGITLEDCEVISRKLDPILDKADPVSNSYFLEVSSPGLDRPLKRERDFIRHIDEKVEVKLYKTYNDLKYFTGVNKGISNDFLKVLLDNDILFEVPMDLVASVKLYFEI